MKIIDAVAAVLVIVGGINWGLVGLFAFDLVGTIFGGAVTSDRMSILSRLVFLLVGASAIYLIVGIKNVLRRWRREVERTAA